MVVKEDFFNKNNWERNREVLSIVVVVVSVIVKNGKVIERNVFWITRNNGKNIEANGTVNLHKT